MKTSNKAFKYLDQLSSLFLLPFVVLAKFLRKIDQKSRKENSSILLVKLCCLGDSVLALPALKSLREKHSGARIDIICSNRNATIFERSALFNAVYVLPVSGLHGWREFARIVTLIGLFRTLIKNCYDVLVDLDIYYRFTSVFGLLPSVQVVAGFRSKGLFDRSFFFDIKATRINNKPEWFLFYDLISFLGVSVTDTASFPVLRVAEIENISSQKIVDDIRSRTSNIVCLIIGSSNNWKEKRWPSSLFVKLISLLKKEINAGFILIGTVDERNLAEDILALTDYRSDILNLVGKTTVAQLISLFSNIDLAVSNDTGPMHLAAALGVPTVGLFGPTNEKKWSSPSYLFTAVVADSCDSRPCEKDGVMISCDGFKCMSSIQPELVFRRLMELKNKRGR